MFSVAVPLADIVPRSLIVGDVSVPCIDFTESTAFFSTGLDPLIESASASNFVSSIDVL
jgi:hypothetical protein